MGCNRHPPPNLSRLLLPMARCKSHFPASFPPLLPLLPFQSSPAENETTLQKELVSFDLASFRPGLRSPLSFLGCCCHGIRPPMQGTEEEFRFLLCEKCQQQLQGPKLLGCLHTVCHECFAESKPVGHCPVCTVSVPRFQDNLLFTHLQADLNTYQQIAAGKELMCSRCKVEAVFWCSECKEFLCERCYEAHQWYLKQKSHETQKIEDLKGDSASKFLAGIRNYCTLYCSNPAHSNQGQISSIYCRQCQKPLCCSCALLDNEHSKFYTDISVEIQQRKEELRRMSEELQETEQSCQHTYSDLQQNAQRVENVWRETQSVIQKKVEEMVQQIRKTGEQLLEEVDKQLHVVRLDSEAKLQAVECVLGRMKTGKRLVEKMADFASDQEVMDMHPFIKESLEELRREKAPMAGLRVSRESFAKIKEHLQVLYRKVMGQNDAASSSNVPPSSQALNAVKQKEAPCNETDHPKTQKPMYTISIEKNPHGFTPSITALRKRTLTPCEKSTQSSPKMPKHEAHDSQEGETSTGHAHVATICPPCAHEMTQERDRRDVDLAEVDQSFLEICESEVTSIIISSSDNSDTETM
ncbi:protein PML [Sphaerodactylus townsendi]|nr:protein PML [Sphaerodactylus townsendi]